MTVQYPTAVNYMNQTNGAMPMLFALRDSIPGAFSALNIVIFFMLIVSQYFIIKNKTGRGKIMTCLLSSSIVMVVLSTFLALSQLTTFMDVLFYAFCAIVFFALYQVSDNW